MPDSLDGRRTRESPDVTVTISRTRSLESSDRGSAETIDEVPPRVGRFIMIEELGRGGMGMVHAAYDPRLDRRVAVKLLRHASTSRSSEGQERLLREAQAMAKLSHPNVITIYEVGTVGADVFLAMELIHGQTLRAWSQALERPRPWREVVAVMRQAGAGLAAAHRADLVHRDFKPDNVLIDHDGRVCVADFGLARATLGPASPGLRSGSTHEDDADAPLTELGTVVGTPGYMAPEQLGRGSFDVRSDQYAFCVTLYEALYRTRLFPGRNFDDLLERKLEIPTLPADRRDIPVWLQRVLQRGLSPDPEHRYPDMESLLEALEHSTTTPMWWLGGGMMLVGLALVGWAYVHTRARAAEVSASCQSIEPRLAGIWDEPRKQTIRRGFASTQLPYAADTWRRLELRLDQHAAQWAQAQHQVCDATWVDRVQPQSLLAVRQACLDQRLSELRAYSTVLLRADPTVVRTAVDGIERLRDPGECREVQSMQTELPLPTDATQAARVVELRQRVDDVQAHVVAGRLDEALVIAQELEESALSLGYLPLLAEIRLHMGAAYDDAGRYDEAAATLERALWDAEVGRHDAAAVDVWTRWIRVVGYHLGQHDRAAYMLPRLDAASTRLGDDALRHAAVLQVRGTLAFAQGAYEDALAHFQGSATILAREVGPDHARIASIQQNIGTCLYRLDRFEESEEALEQALAVGIDLFGDQHPRTAANLLSFGSLALARGEYEAAVRHHQRAAEIFGAAFPVTHPGTAPFHRALGESLAAAGRHQEAIDAFAHALDSERTRRGESELDRETSMALGHALVLGGRHAEAIEHLEWIMKPTSEQAGSDFLQWLHVRACFDLARALWVEQPERREHALTLARRALRALESAHGLTGRPLPGVVRAEIEHWLAERGEAGTGAVDGSVQWMTVGFL